VDDDPLEEQGLLCLIRAAMHSLRGCRHAGECVPQLAIDGLPHVPGRAARAPGIAPLAVAQPKNRPGFGPMVAYPWGIFNWRVQNSAPRDGARPRAEKPTRHVPARRL